MKPVDLPDSSHNHGGAIIEGESSEADTTTTTPRKDVGAITE